MRPVTEFWFKNKPKYSSNKKKQGKTTVEQEGGVNVSCRWVVCGTPVHSPRCEVGAPAVEETPLSLQDAQ